MQSGENQPAIHRLLSSGQKRKTNTETGSVHYMLHAGSLLVLLSNPEDGGNMFQ
jgi:hypothetical protein